MRAGRASSLREAQPQVRQTHRSAWISLCEATGVGVLAGDTAYQVGSDSVTAMLESHSARNGARCVPSRGNGAFGPSFGALGPHMQTTARPAGAQRSGPDAPVQQQVAADEHAPLTTGGAAGRAAPTRASDCSNMATMSRERIGMIIDRSP